MKFGLLSSEELAQLNWELPLDHASNEVVLNGKSQEINVLNGCAKWNMKSWVGIHYPKETKEKDYINEYLKLFKSIELNSTFYRLSRSSITSWMEEVGNQDFIFCPKWSRRVSHLKRLKDVDENIQYFMDSCQLFGDKLGPSFLQMPDNFTPKYFDRIEHFLNQVPDSFKVHIELRHKEWFEEPAFNEISDLLKEKKQGFVITDVAGRRDVLHQRLTCDQVMIRFNGYGPETTDNQRLDAWTNKLASWFSMGLNKAFFFFHHQDDTLGPTNSNYFAQQIISKSSS